MQACVVEEQTTSDRPEYLTEAIDRAGNALHHTLRKKWEGLYPASKADVSTDPQGNKDATVNGAGDPHHLLDGHVREECGNARHREAVSKRYQCETRNERDGRCNEGEGSVTKGRASHS